MTTQPADGSSFGSALRERRQHLGLTQVELAARAGVGRQWLNAFEMGDKPSAPLDMVLRVAAALDVEVVLGDSPASGSGDEPVEVPAVPEGEPGERARGGVSDDAGERGGASARAALEPASRGHVPAGFDLGSFLERFDPVATNVAEGVFDAWAAAAGSFDVASWLPGGLPPGLPPGFLDAVMASAATIDFPFPDVPGVSSALVQSLIDSGALGLPGEKASNAVAGLLASSGTFDPTALQLSQNVVDAIVGNGSVQLGSGDSPHDDPDDPDDPVDSDGVAEDADEGAET